MYTEKEILYRSYGCKTKEEFDEYKLNNPVMTLKELRESIKALKKKKLITKHKDYYSFDLSSSELKKMVQDGR